MKTVHAILRHPLCLALLCGLGASPSTQVRAADVNFFGVLKNQAFTQTSAAAPTQNGMFTFRSFARSKAPNLITVVGLRLPNGSSASTAYVLDSSGQEMDLRQDFAQKTQMDTAYPSGSYTVNLTTQNDGSHSVQLTLPPDAYPLAPHVSNFLDAQNINAGAGFTLTWDTLSGGTTNDFAQIIIKDSTGNQVYQSPPPGQAGALNGTSTSILISANMLSPGRSYSGELLFMKVALVNTTAYPGAVGFTGFSETTTFALGAATAGTPTADVQFYLIQKRVSFVQTGTGAPALDTGSPPYRFEADLIASGTGLVNSASVRIPGGTSQPLSSQSGGTEFQFKQNFSTASALTTAFPTGNYLYNISAVHDGTKTPSLTMTADHYPAAPHVGNFTAAQAVNAAASFALTWDAFAGGSTNDLVSVEVNDNVTGQTVFQTALPGNAGTLDGTAVSVVIPANTLMASHTYQGRVSFERVDSIDDMAYPGAEGVVLFTARTSFNIVTAASTGSGPDVTDFHVVKGQQFAQTGAGAPVLNGATPYVFDASAGLSASNAATGSIKLPGGTVKPLSVRPDQLRIKEAYASQASLDTADPDGNYIITLNTVHDGNKSITLNLSGVPFPNAPHISNFTAAQSVNPGAGFTLTWDAFSAGTVNDFISVDIEDPTGNGGFSSSNPGSPGALNGMATAFVVPANALQPGKVYSAKLTFIKTTATDTTSYPGVVGLAAYFRETDFNLTTTGGTVSGPDVTQYHVAKGQQFIQTGTGAPVLNGATPYIFDASANLSAANAATGTLTLPNSTSKPFNVQPDELKLKEAYASQTSLDAADPDGNYTFTLITVHDGTKNLTLNLSGVPFPNAPHVSNFTAAQTINPGASFTLTWDAFTAGTVNDFIAVDINDQAGNGAFGSGDPGAAGALNGTSTAIVIPANTLQPGKTYAARLTFIKGTAKDTTSYPGALGLAGYVRETDFTVTTTGGTVAGPDVQTYFVVKGQQFFQTSTNPPAPRPDVPFFFGSFVNATATGDVASVSVQGPIGSPVTFASQNNGGSFQFINGFSTKNALDTAYPSGTYTMSITTTHNGLQNPALHLPADNYPSTVPFVSNFTASQTIDPTADFMLTWGALTGGTTNDFIQFSLQDTVGNTVFETPQVATPGALGGTAVSVVIPRGTLLPGQMYFATLRFARSALDTNSYPGAVGVAAYFTSTDLTIVTKGATPPTFSKPARLAAGGFQSHLVGQANQTYAIQVSSDLSNWTPLTNVTTAADGTVDFIDTGASSISRRFYRVVASGLTPTGNFSLSFNHYANTGAFGANTTPTGVFPASLNGYRAIFGVRNDSALPAVTNVSFTGPAGSGLASTPAEIENNQGSGNATYISPYISNPSAAPGGSWTVNYKGIPQNFNVPDPQAAARLVMPVPTVTIVNGTLQQITWVYQSPSGATLNGPPSFMTGIQIQISGQGFVRLYDSPNLAPSTTTQILATGSLINWSAVTSIAMAYEDTSGNTFIVFFNH
jgi:hypothetical protein